MNAVIFHGGQSGDEALEEVHTLLHAELTLSGWSVDTLRIASMNIHPCTGCFGCWTTTPGECLQKDDGRETARASVQHDLVIFLTPVSFGGYSGLLKTAIDRQVPNISPLFLTINGEMHHKKRYPRYPALVGVGWQAEPDAGAGAIFTRLIARNALNMHSPQTASLVLTGAQSAAERQARLHELVKTLEVA